MQSTPPRLGPVFLCTLLSPDGRALADAYCGWMHQQLSAKYRVDADSARALGFAELSGCKAYLLANAAGLPWLQIIEHPGATSRDSLATFGWMALEVVVEDVDTLAASLAGSPFEQLRPPADLDVSDNIRACQVRGPAGEVLYLTQINGEAPPFELPRAAAPVDHVFIPILSTPSRDASLAEYSAISGNSGLSFDTRITVVNQARGYELARRHPVATLQLAGNSLIEIDQISDTGAAPGALCYGVINIAFDCRGEHGGRQVHRQGPFAGTATSYKSGAGGEQYTLVYR